MSGIEHRAGSVAALKAGESILAEIDGIDVALFLCEGEVVATQGQCPHAEGPLHEGDVDECILTCPWHGWTFNLKTGHCGEDDSIVLQRFPARVVGDDVMVTL